MNKTIWACALALVTAASPAAAQRHRVPVPVRKHPPPMAVPAPPVPPPDGPEVIVDDLRTITTPLLRGVLPIGDTNRWMLPVDYPAAALAASESGWVRLHLTIGRTGLVQACTVAKSSASERLQAAACPAIRRRGHFRYALDENGAAASAEVDLELVYSMVRMRAAPLPSVFPPAVRHEIALKPGLRINKYRAVSLRSDPVWRDFAPPGHKGSAEVVVEVILLPTGRGRPPSPFCSIEDSSGDPALDQATCNALKSAVFRRTDAPWGNDSQLFLVRWHDDNANYSVPRKLHGDPLRLVNEGQVFSIPTPSTALKDPEVDLVFRADGGFGCTITVSTGNDRADAQVCATLHQRVLFTPASDIFGRNIDTRRTIAFHWRKKD
jgi:TonB family protein